VQLSHSWSLAAPVFDDANLVSFAGLVPIMALAERAGLSQLISEMVRIDPGTTKVRSAGVNPAGKLTSIAGMACGADCIDDLDMIRAGGMKRLFGGVYAAPTLGQLLREFTHGHTMQLSSVLRGHLLNLVTRSGLLPGVADRAYVDIDSLLRPVYGHAKQGASFGHTKIAAEQVLRKGLSGAGGAAALGATAAGNRLAGGYANHGLRQSVPAVTEHQRAALPDRGLPVRECAAAQRHAGARRAAGIRVLSRRRPDQRQL
jgi:hypothetical protein